MEHEAIMKPTGYRAFLGILLAAALPAARAADPAAPAAPPAGAALVSHGAAEGVSESLRREALASAARAVAWLVANQNADGHWSSADYPALTGLPLWALARSGQKDSEAARKAVAWLLQCVHENGAIFKEAKEPGKGGLSNYNTAICMVALHLAGDPKLVPVVQKARSFIAKTQHLGGDVYYGGMGYDAASGRAYADLSNSYLAYEAMRLTESVEDLRKPGEPKADLDWKAARKFVQRTHNDPRFNDQPWASDDPSEQGGFVYNPAQTRSGTYTNAQGVVKLRSMRGMTYAGMLSYIYADVDRTDPRVEATVDWTVRHWNLGGNNQVSGGRAKTDTQDDREGLYYLYNVMAKGLAAYGKDVFRPKDRPAFNWRVQMIERLLSLQKAEAQSGRGYWINEVGRYWESDPVLVTSYALIALQIALGS